MKTKKSREFFEALDYIATEKGVEINSLVKKLENAIILAVKKQYGVTDNIKVIIDHENGRFDVSFSKLVVDDVKNPSTEISFKEAIKFYKNVKIGQYIEIDVDSTQIGRLAAQAAKQQIMQGIREIERNSVIEKVGDKIGRILTVKVEMIDPIFKNVIFKIDDSEVILFKNQQLFNDNFVVGDMVKVYAIEVDSSGSGSLIKISRTHPNFVKKLFELEVPEVEEGKVEIKGVARQAGLRTKIAVLSHDENVDPIGCFIGSRGTRIEQILKELNGEKIDVLNYSHDNKKFIKSALAPAKVVAVEIFEVEGAEKIAYVLVPSSQTSLAIGAGGVNVKLAAMLTGFKIDIIAQTENLYAENFKNFVEDKFNAKLRRFSNVTIKRDVKKTKKEIEEEEDIHILEVEKMLNELDKK